MSQRNERQQAISEKVDKIRRKHKLCRSSTSQSLVLQQIVEKIFQDLQQQVLHDVDHEIDKHPLLTPKEWANLLCNSALKTVLTDARLNELALAAKAAVTSNERKVALNLLVEGMYIADRFCYPNNASFSLPPGVYEYVYNEAIQITLLEICQNIDNYNPNHDVMAWVNFLLSRRFSDVRNKYVRHGIRELPKDSKNPVVSLNEPETIEKFWRKEEAESKSQQFREFITEDPDNIFTKEHIQNRPDANFRVIVLERIWGGKTWENISEELRIPIPTLCSFYHRCLKKFRNYFQEYFQE